MVLRWQDVKPPQIETVCVKHQPLQQLNPTARVWRTTKECNVSYVYIVDPPKIGYQVTVHRSCSCNELRALYNRHLIDRTLQTYHKQYMLEHFRRVSKKWKFEVEPTTYTNIVNNYHGGKRRMYARARLELLQFGNRSTDHHVRMFVKPDKYGVDEINDKVPRAIQYRNPRYNLKIATFLKPFEDAFYHLEGQDGLRVIVKGMNHVEQADLMIQKSLLFNNPVYISCDHSKFDSTINVDHLKFEHSVYDRSYRNGHLRMLLRKQLRNRGFTRHGMHYKVEGTRMSGDYNTSLGNCLINRAVLESWVWHVKHSIILDGDDSVIIVEAPDINKLDVTHFSRCGFTTELQLNYALTEVEFCRKRLLMSTPPVLVRNPLRILSNKAVCLRNYGPLGFDKWAFGVMECERLITPNLPIVRHFTAGKVIKDEDYHRKLEAGIYHGSIEATCEQLAETWDLDINTVRALDQPSEYLGWNSGDIIRKLKNHYSSLLSEQRDDSEYASCTTLHRQEIGTRYTTLCPGFIECWNAHGAPILGYESYARCFACRPTPIFKPP
ncbi:MAG: RNA-dependent RNA polymerase [Guiyang tombus-like virus 1]|nr:MAG: RNA-dependent RNA polymerase [Guiyang tombus-like virus 1]